MSAKQQRKENYPVIFGGRGTVSSSRERVLLLAVAGFGIALMLGVIAVMNFKSDANAKQAVNAGSGFDPSKQLVYAFSRAVRAGEKIAIDNVSQVSWGRNDVPRDAVMVAQEIEGMYAKNDIPAGVALARSMLAREPSMVTLPVTPGNRAVAIDVDATSGIEGHALPGTKVDVVLTYFENDGLTSKIIVQNARILSAGGDTRGAAQMMGQQVTGPRKSASTVTLDVGVKDALEIQTARQLGRLSLFMRAADDDKAAAVIETNRNDISGNKKSVAKTQKCRTGRMRSGGKEYVVDCDGGVSELVPEE